MLSLLVYSGKGGVGKTTVTYCLYKAFKAAGHNVAVIDMDLNTPSFHLLDNSDDIISATENLGLFIDTAQINNFIKLAKKRVNQLKPDILLIDSPPSITHIHYTLMEKFDLSGVILVTQPTELSISDVEKTVPFFEQKDITVTGIVENMAEGATLDYRYRKLASVPRTNTLDSHLVYQENSAVFASLTAALLAMDLKAASLENRKTQLFDESITMSAVRSMYSIQGDEDEGYYLDPKSKKTGIKHIKFVNLATWAVLRDIILDMDRIARHMLSIGGHWEEAKDVVSEARYEAVERLLKAFEEDDKALFMIVRNAGVGEVLMGEIGTCTLLISDKHHGIPCVEYQSSIGAITLFPHEVMPADQSLINESIKDGYFYIDNGARMIPPLELAQQLNWMAGGGDISDRWNSAYDRSQLKKVKSPTAQI